jgi:nitrogen fixation NifU-like protein
MSELRELYQATILDHNKQPRNFRRPADADREAQGYNPLCGDRVTVYVTLDGDKIADVAFQGAGCAISTASASLMTQAVKGKPLAEALALFEGFHALVTGDPTQEPDVSRVGKLAVFAGVREYPVRVKCATLAWHTLKAALESNPETVRTE